MGNEGQTAANFLQFDKIWAFALKLGKFMKVGGWEHRKRDNLSNTPKLSELAPTNNANGYEPPVHTRCKVVFIVL